MTAQTTQKLAGLLGYSLGRCVRFFFQDQNSALRWVKRCAFFILVAVLVAQTVTWFVSVFLSVACFGLIIWALPKMDVAPGAAPSDSPHLGEEYHSNHEQDDAIWRDGPEGWGYYRPDDVRTDF